MNYCSIQEAWEKNDNISCHYKKYNNSYDPDLTKKNSLENFSSTQNVESHLNKINNCHDFLLHLETCASCHQAVRNKYRPKILENFSDVIETNKDIIILILIGISIMLFFNLIRSVT